MGRVGVEQLAVASERGAAAGRVHEHRCLAGQGSDRSRREATGRVVESGVLVQCTTACGAQPGQPHADTGCGEHGEHIAVHVALPGVHHAAGEEPHVRVSVGLRPTPIDVWRPGGRAAVLRCSLRSHLSARGSQRCAADRQPSGQSQSTAQACRQETGALQQRQDGRASEQKPVVAEGLVGEPLPARDRPCRARHRRPCVGHEAAERNRASGMPARSPGTARMCRSSAGSRDRRPRCCPPPRVAWLRCDRVARAPRRR